MVGFADGLHLLLRFVQQIFLRISDCRRHLVSERCTIRRNNTDILDILFAAASHE